MSHFHMQLPDRFKLRTKLLASQYVTVEVASLPQRAVVLGWFNMLCLSTKMTHEISVVNKVLPFPGLEYGMLMF